MQSRTLHIPRAAPEFSLALTKDFRSFERYGVIMSPDDKDAALLPYRIGGLWALIHRPMTSLELIFGFLTLRSKSLGRPSGNDGGAQGRLVGCQQDWPVLAANRNSARLAHPVTTESGRPPPDRCTGWAWPFSICKSRMCVYCGAIPGSSEPKTDYERGGDVHDVVFPCGHTISPDGDTVNIYYGAGDSCIALAQASLRSLLNWLDHKGEPSGLERNC